MPDLLSNTVVRSPEPATAIDPAPFQRALASELREIRDGLEALATVLVSDPLAVRYLKEFQAFDHLVQHTDECATLLERMARGESVTNAIGAIRLDAVQHRIRLALGAA